MHSTILIAKGSSDYELLDSGREMKLERYGDFMLTRPDPQALWEKALPDSEWKKASAWYERKAKGGVWHTKGGFQKEWPIAYGGFKFLIRPTSFKHTGLFPEQLPNWEWIEGIIRANGSKARILNLFAYTGGATLAAARAGAEVVHVDASKIAVLWAKENAVHSHLSEKPIRWIVEDVLVFLRREIKRGNTYDGIIMDPPSFGHGPKDELWKIEEDFLTMMKLCRLLVSEKPLFFLINGYASGYSHFAFAHNLEIMEKDFGGHIESGELTIQESTHSKVSGQETGRLLPCGIFARLKF